MDGYRPELNGMLTSATGALLLMGFEATPPS
jgi:hypothetical protein